MRDPDFSQIEVVFFDAGHTLLKPEPTVERRYARTAALHGVDVDPAAIKPRFAQLWKRGREKREKHLYRTDDAGTRLFWRDFVREVFEPWLGPAVDFDAFFEQLYEDFATQSAWLLFDDALPSLERLKRLGYRLAVISNWDARLPVLFERLSITDFFEAIITSADVGYEKPAKEIFEKALEVLDVSPEACVHVGDSYEDDVRGALGSGLGPVLLDRDGQAERQKESSPYLIVTSLEEMTNRLALARRQDGQDG